MTKEELGLERNLKSSKSNCLAQHCQLQHKPVSQQHIHTAFKFFPGQPVQIPEHPFSKEIFPNTQPKPPQHNMSLFALVLSLVTWEKDQHSPLHSHPSCIGQKPWHKHCKKFKCLSKKDYIIRIIFSQAWGKEIKPKIFTYKAKEEVPRSCWRWETTSLLQQRPHQRLFESAAHLINLRVPSSKRENLVLINSLETLLGFEDPEFKMGA